MTDCASSCTIHQVVLNRDEVLQLLSGERVRHDLVAGRVVEVDVTDGVECAIDWRDAEEGNQ